MNALGATPLTIAIKIRKLNFARQLMQNRLTRKILEHQLENRSKLANKSFVRELVKISGINIFTIDATNIVRLCRAEANKLKSITENSNSTKKAKAIRYLLNHRNKSNDELQGTLTHNES